MKKTKHNTMYRAIVGLAGLFAVVYCTLGVALAVDTTEFASTFLGGSDSDSITNSVRDANGNIYVAGATKSADFPTTPGVHGPAYHGGTSDLG